MSRNLDQKFLKLASLLRTPSQKTIMWGSFFDEVHSAFFSSSCLWVHFSLGLGSHRNLRIFKLGLQRRWLFRVPENGFSFF